MSLRDFTIRQMIRVTARWLGPLRSRIAAVKELSGSLELLERIHSGMLGPSAPKPEDRVRQIGDQQKPVDRRHDRWGRGVMRTLLACADFAETPEEEERFLKLHDELFPLGFDTSNLSYDEEAGAVELLESKLTPELRALLSGIPVRGGGNLLERLEGHIAAGRELGSLEDQKNAAKQAPQAPSLQGQQNAARLAWIGGVNAFLALLSAAKMPEIERAALREPVRLAEEVVARRKRGEEVPDEEDAPEDPSGGAPTA